MSVTIRVYLRQRDGPGLFVELERPVAGIDDQRLVKAQILEGNPQ
jgi:hypothetical protein